MREIALQKSAARNDVKRIGDGLATAEPGTMWERGRGRWLSRDLRPRRNDIVILALASHVMI